MTLDLDDTFVYTTDDIRAVGGYTESTLAFMAVYNHNNWSTSARYSAGPSVAPTDSIGYIDFKEISGATTKLKSLM